MGAGGGCQLITPSEGALNKSSIQQCQQALTPSDSFCVLAAGWPQVHSVEDVVAVLRSGYELRQTSGSDETSRSHTVFTLSVVQPQRDGQPPVTGTCTVTAGSWQGCGWGW